MAEKKQEQQVVITSKKIEEIKKKENLGQKLSREDKIWFKNIKGVRKASVPFGYTNQELNEKLKCKLSIHYFAENYCKIKLEDGTIGQMKIRDYQQKIIDLYNNNRFSILMASRQVGKCTSPFSLINIKDETTNEIYETTFYQLYYNTIKVYRKLFFTEKVKYFLYKLYEKI